MTIGIAELWTSTEPTAWQAALERYWHYLRPENVDLEHRMDSLDIEWVRKLDKRGWFDFLLNDYFRWKYTAPNRYATTTANLRRYETDGTLEGLLRIKGELLDFDVTSIRLGLSIAWAIDGLGPSGSSGLLAILHPQWFGTCDQFVVKALRTVKHLPEASNISRMNPEGLTINHCVVLIEIMRRKAIENTRGLHSAWTPRMIDKVLWTLGHHE
jgi:hypothetical protein